MRVFVNLLWRAELHHAPVVEHADAVGQRERFDLVVRDIEHGGAGVLLYAFELQTQVIAQLGVQRGQRLVHQVDRRIAHQRPAYGHALHLPAREFGRRVLQLVFHAQHAGDFEHLGFDIGLVGFAQRRAQRKGQVVVDAEVRVQRVLLEHKGHIAQGRGQSRDIAPGYGDAAAVGRLQPGHQAQGGGFACAAGAQ